MTKQITELPTDPSPADTDVIETQKPAGGPGTSFKNSKTDFLADIQAEVDANTAKVSADGSVTTHSDVSNAGSGQIITTSERNAITANSAKVSADGSVTTHNDVTDAGSGQIITATERANITGSVTVHSDVINAGSGAIITTAERNNIIANNAKVSADGSIDTHSDVDVSTSAPVDGQQLVFDGTNWVPEDPPISVVSGTWTYRSQTGAADPGSGSMRTNNSDLSLVTELYVSQTAENGQDSPFFFQSISPGDDFYLQESADSDTTLTGEVVSVTDNTGWWTIVLTNTATGADTSIGNNQNVLLAHQRAAGGGGGSGTYNEVEEATVSQSTNRAKLNFIGTGEATVTVTDDGPNDRTTIEINASAAGGGGGIGLGPTQVVGDLLFLSSATGDGTAETAGFDISELAKTTDLANYLPLAGGNMSGVLQAFPGTTAAPGMTFAPTTGFSWDGTNLSFSIAGAQVGYGGTQFRWFGNVFADRSASDLQVQVLGLNSGGGFTVRKLAASGAGEVAFGQTSNTGGYQRSWFDYEVDGPVKLGQDADLDLSKRALLETYTAAAGNTFAAREVGYIDASGTVTKADNTAEATANGEMLMAIEAITAGQPGRFVSIGTLKGFTGLTAGGLVYLGTAGAVTQTVPTGAGTQVRILGRATAADSVSFKPSADWIELSA